MSVFEGASVGLAFFGVLIVCRGVVISRGHDEIDVVIEEDVADLEVKSAPHGVVREVLSLSGDEIAWADDDVRLASDDVGDGVMNYWRITDGAVTRVDIGNDGDANGVWRRWQIRRGGITEVVVGIVVGELSVAGTLALFRRRGGESLGIVVVGFILARSQAKDDDGEEGEFFHF